METLLALSRFTDEGMASGLRMDVRYKNCGKSGRRNVILFALTFISHMQV
jgi:hypothetical protein